MPRQQMGGLTCFCLAIFSPFSIGCQHRQRIRYRPCPQVAEVQQNNARFEYQVEHGDFSAAVALSQERQHAPQSHHTPKQRLLHLFYAALC